MDLFGSDATTLSTDPASIRVATVALERSIDKPGGGLSYAVPDDLADLGVGDRVTVPLGRGNTKADGVVTRMATADGLDFDPAKLKPVTRRHGSPAGMAPELVKLCEWVASYYCCPLGMVLGAAQPSAVKKQTGVTRTTWVAAADDAPTHDDQPKPTKLQRAVLDAARAHAGDPDRPRDPADPLDGWLTLPDLAARAGAKTTGPIKRLVEAGLLRAQAVDTLAGDVLHDADPDANPLPALPPPVLTDAQAAAVDHLIDHLDAFGTHLLHGVTGSGKTEVYLRVIERLLDDDPDATAVVLVPEIALTPQTSRRFQQRLGRFGVALMHSGMNATARHAHWQRLATGRARIAVGPRSAVFAPCRRSAEDQPAGRLGILIVDEEHDASYKSDQLPRYHARDVAIRRAQLAGCPVVLGSATPSMESLARALDFSADPATGPITADLIRDAAPTRPASAGAPATRHHYLPLHHRVPGAEFPTVEVLDLAEERRQRKGVHLLSLRMEDLLASTHAQGGQSILLLNRRGFANYISCPDHNCGWLMGCDHCDALMTFHLDARLPSQGSSHGGGVVQCHHCTAEKQLPHNCPDCSKLVTTFGMGTQRIELELQRKFPRLRLDRMDADTMNSAEDYRATLDRFVNGETDVLLGTQMIAKGLDVPNVRFVGIVSADTALSLPDFRAVERTYQLIAQVAGRAGRAQHRGRVLLQTFNPDDPAIRDAARHDYAAFAARELETRRRSQLPPFHRMTRVVTRHLKRETARAAATETFNALRAADADLKLGARFRPPAPCPLSRVADHFRFQVEVLTPTAAAMQKLLTALRNRGLLISDHHTNVDVDPLSLL